MKINLNVTEKKTDYRQFHKEGFRKIYTHLLYTFVFSGLFGLTLFVLGLVFKIWPVMIIGIVVVAIEGIMAFATAHSNHKDVERMEKNFEKNNGDSTEVVYEFGEDIITKKYWDGYGVKMLYIDAKAFIETEHYFMISFKHDYIYYISKEFISQEQIKQIIDFCKEKNSKIKSYKI